MVVKKNINSSSVSDKEAYTKALNLFVAEDSFEPWMQNPFTIGEKAYATTNNMVACLDKNLVDELNELKEDKKGTVLGVIPNGRNIDFTFPVSRIEKILGELPLVDEVINNMCFDCDGSGEVEFEYTSNKGITYETDGECPVCNGRGTIERKMGGKVRDMSGVVRIGNHCFMLPRFKLVVRAAQILGAKDIKTVLLATKHNASVFEVGEMTILIMPANMDSDEETPKIVDVIQIE